MGLRFFLAALCAFALSSCVEATIAWTSLKPDGPAAAPPLDYKSLADWEAKGAPAARKGLQSDVYGFFPDAYSSRIISHAVLDKNAFDGAGVLEEYRVGADVTFNGATREIRDRDGKDGFIMDVALPKGDGPFPVLLMETFCPRWSTLPSDKLAGAPHPLPKHGWFRLEKYVFGRYICTPPVETLLEKGYAVATIFPTETIPDRKVEGLEELRRLSAGYKDDRTRWGAIAAWAFEYSRMVDALETDPRIDKSAIIAWGHSRYAKSALLATAFDTRISGVIAHQSGTGGASLTRHKKGESVERITSTYPHWFAESYRNYIGDDDGPAVDQHMLLALIAPRPILLGNARRDVWSDPNGAFRAALGADPVYRLYGEMGLDQKRLVPYEPASDIAFWIRPGTHGVVKEDWPAFLQFLDAHFKPRKNDGGHGGRVLSSGK